MKLADWRGGRAAQAIFWVAACFSFVMAAMPHPPELPGEPNDKVEHMIAFATLALLAAFAYPRTAPLRLLVGLSAFGALIEVVQTIPALQRDSDIKDWAADTVAAGVVLAVVWWQRRAASA